MRIEEPANIELATLGETEAAGVDSGWESAAAASGRAAVNLGSVADHLLIESWKVLKQRGRGD